jgi:hypothetical protein
MLFVPDYSGCGADCAIPFSLTYFDANAILTTEQVAAPGMP